MTLLITVAVLAVAITVHVAGAAAAAAHRKAERDTTVPVERLARLARSVAWWAIWRALWFLALASCAGWIVFTTDERVPVVEIILVYGAIVAISTALGQARDWFATARDHRAGSDLAAVQTVVTSDGRRVIVPRNIIRMLEAHANDAEGRQP